MKTVIEMAREAGLLEPDDTEEEIRECGLEVWLFGEKSIKAFERFAELVRDDEKNKWQDQTAVEIHEAILDEREACAQIAEEPSATTYECTVACGGPAQTFQQRMPKAAHEIAKEIRARSNT